MSCKSISCINIYITYFNITDSPSLSEKMYLLLKFEPRLTAHVIFARSEQQLCTHKKHKMIWNDSPSLTRQVKMQNCNCTLSSEKIKFYSRVSLGFFLLWVWGVSLSF